MKWRRKDVAVNGGKGKRMQTTTEARRWASVGRGECEHRLDGGGVRKGAVGWMAEDLGGRGVGRLYYRLF